MTTQEIVKTTRFTSRFFASASIACYAYSSIVLVLMHLLRPDYTLVDHMISDYAVGRYGWIMGTCFLAMGCGCLMLLFGLARSGLSSRAARVGTFLLALPTIGLMISAVYTTDLEDATVSTPHGQIHDIAFLVNVTSIIFAAVLLTVGFGAHPRWRPYRRSAIALTSLVVLAFLIQFLTLHRGAPYGITNRLFVLALFAWFLTTSIRLRKMSSD